MNTVLLSVGAACIVLAIVGGGGKVLGVELPAIHQPWRIVTLAAAGAGFLLAAYLTREPPIAGESAEVKAYRTAVAQVCASMKPNTDAFAAAMNNDGTFDRARLQQALRGQADELRSIMTQLWKRSVPHELAGTVTTARAVSDDAVTAVDAQIAVIPTKLPKTISIQRLQEWSTDFSAKLSSHDTALRSALSELSRQPCTTPTPGQGR